MITKNLFNAALAILGVAFLASCQKDMDQLSTDLDQATLRSVNFTLSPKAALGRKIYFDKRFSSTGTQSCSSCHMPEQGFVGKGTVNSATAPGFLAGIGEGAVKGRFGGRKPPSASYATFTPAFHFDVVAGEYQGGLFWDGRAMGSVTGTVAGDQAIGPFLAGPEMNMPSETSVLQIIADDPTYQALWKAAWGSNLTLNNATDHANYLKVGLVIGEYEGSPEVNQFSSKYDAWLKAGAPAGGGGIMSSRELQGMALFQSARCANCHIMDGTPDAPNGLFADFAYHNLGLPSNFDFINQRPGNAPYTPDPGLMTTLQNQGVTNVTALADAEGAFRTPTLRNVAKGEGNKRYMHNGVLTSLKEVVHFYNTRDLTGPTTQFPQFTPWPSPEFALSVVKGGNKIGNLGLSSAQEDLIVEFMRTLSDGYTKPTVTATQRVL